MKCPYCGTLEDKVVDSRPSDEGETIRRRRECARCLKRFTTYEKVEIQPLVVIKKDNSRENFNRDKLMRGISRACEKRPISADEMHKLADQIETQLSNSLEREVTSQSIGELLMEKLRMLDQVAYVRFASVYRDFGDIDTFLSEIHKIRTEDNTGNKTRLRDEPPPPDASPGNGGRLRTAVPAPDARSRAVERRRSYTDEQGHTYADERRRSYTDEHERAYENERPRARAGPSQPPTARPPRRKRPRRLA